MCESNHFLFFIDPRNTIMSTPIQKKPPRSPASKIGLGLSPLDGKKRKFGHWTDRDTTSLSATRRQFSQVEVIESISLRPDCSPVNIFKVPLAERGENVPTLGTERSLLKEITSLKKQISTMHDERSELEIFYEGLVVNMQIDAQHREQKIDELEALNLEQAKMIEVLKTENVAQAKEIKNLKAENAAQAKKIEDLQTENAMQVKQIQSQSKQIEDLQKQVKDLQTEFQNMVKLGSAS